MVAVNILTLVSDDMDALTAPLCLPLTPLMAAFKKTQNNTNGNSNLLLR